jgi:hypothetical protein
MPETHHFHTFDGTRDAYDASQCDDGIRDGDVLVVPAEGVIGILVQAWPTAVVWDRASGSGSFHQCRSWTEHGLGDYSTSVKLALETAHSDADITGNDHWRETDAMVYEGDL